MAEVDVENAEKALAYFIDARRRAASNLRKNYDQGMHRGDDTSMAEAYVKIQNAVEAARSAVIEEQNDPSYLQDLSEQLMDG